MEKSVKFKSHHYRPLIPEVTIKPSNRDGLGLFATEDLKAGVFLGETHIWEDKRWNWIRTPLGGFINHSAYPNAVIIMCDTRHERKLYTIRPIEAGEEISIYYTLYYPLHKEILSGND